MGFSFFGTHGYAGRRIRGNQVADYLGGRMDPTEGYENDVCIYILGTYRYKEPEVKWSYYDVCDCGGARLQRIRTRTTGGIIAFSKSQFIELEKIMPGRKIYFIPHHHANFNRETRPKRPVLTVGCCGGDTAIQWPHQRLIDIFSGYGLQWMFVNHLRDRQKVLEFYRNLDIQIVYRPSHNRGNYMIPHGNPIKLSNAGSFGIPTVAFPEPAFTEEWGKNECLYNDGMGGIIKTVLRLKEEPAFYEDMAERVKVKAEEYHMDNIVKFYKALPGA